MKHSASVLDGIQPTSAPTGAIGMNLAVSDFAMLGEALVDFFEEGSTDGIRAGRHLRWPTSRPF